MGPWKCASGWKGWWEGTSPSAADAKRPSGPLDPPPRKTLLGPSQGVEHEQGCRRRPARSHSGLRCGTWNTPSTSPLGLQADALKSGDNTSCSRVLDIKHSKYLLYKTALGSPVGFCQVDEPAYGQEASGAQPPLSCKPRSSTSRCTEFL